MQKHISSVDVFKTVQERTVQNSLQARSTDCETVSTATHVSDEKRKSV